MKLMHGLREFILWLCQVLKKGIWLLGFLPALLDYVFAYIPADYIPARISNLLEAGANWQLTLILVAIGLLISAFLVHSEIASKLAAYEYQEPKYELEITEVSGERCARGCHVRVLCYFSMKGTTPWRGDLAGIAVYGKNPLKGLGCWTVKRKRCSSFGQGRFLFLDLPFTIPHPECDFEVLIESEIGELVDPEQRKEWENAAIPLSLVIRYFTRPVGTVQTELPLNIPVNLGQEFDSTQNSPRPPKACVEKLDRTFVG